jgi:magnesium chelatase family protein
VLSKTGSVALVGTTAHLVDVEVDVGQGLPTLVIVGLPTTSVREAEQRTRSALQESGENWPGSRKVANLAPAGLRKEGTHFDLPLAVALVAADKRLPLDALRGWLFMGELALDGSVRSVRGVLPAAITCRQAGLKGIICPASNAAEAVAIDGIEVVPVRTLRECFAFLRGKWSAPPIEVERKTTRSIVEDMQEVRGQVIAKRALEIAAAGGHNLLLEGSPGAGKTMLARRLPGILPTMSQDEALDVTKVHSVAGTLPEKASLVDVRPFRTPHHHVSSAGLIGGGAGLAKPGEVSLAHHGVLFLDELPLYRHEVLESLRGPVEDGYVRIARSGGVVTYPCRFSLIAAMNPCPCGHFGDGRRACRCSDHERQRYHNKLSGPLLDRVDMRVGVSRLTKKELLGPPDGDSSDVIRARVEAARRMQAERYGSRRVTNASAMKFQLDASVSLAPTAEQELSRVIDHFALSGRGVNRVLRVARTIADLVGDGSLGAPHIAEAVLYRRREDGEGVAA